MSDREKRVFRYAHPDGRPLLNCPHCGHDLTASVLLELDDIDGRHGEEETSLDTMGRLTDTPDGDVERGKLTDTLCGECGESIQAHEFIDIED